jgi:hypothetical protein
MSRDNRRERSNAVYVPEVVTGADPLPVDAMSRSEVEAQVLTARRFPRDIKASLAELETIVLASMEAASLCVYSMPRGNTYIDGPSVKFAEALVYCMGNIRAGGRPVLREADTVMCVGVAWDCQRNNAMTSGIKRRITDRDGNRYTDDMIVMTENAGSSIAKRNAILDVFPEVLYWPIYEKAREMAMGKSEPIEKLRDRALRTLTKWGLKPERVCARLGIAKWEDINHEHYLTLKTLARQIKENEMTVEQAFPAIDGEPATQAKPGETADDLLAAIVKADPELGTVVDGMFKALQMNAAQRLQKLNEFKGRTGDLRLNLEEEVARARAEKRGSFGTQGQAQAEPVKEQKRSRRAQPKEQAADAGADTGIVDALGGEPRDEANERPEPEPPKSGAKSSALDKMRQAYTKGGSL